MGVKKYVFALLLIIEYFNVAYAQNHHCKLHDTEEKETLIPVFDISRLPVHDSLKLFVCFTADVKTELTYNRKRGFKNKEAKVLLKGFIKKYHINEIVKTFTKLKHQKLQNIYTFSLNNVENAVKLLESLRKEPFVQYAEFVPAYYYFLTPNDLKPQQIPYMLQINAQSAWNIVQGSPSVKIAIVDDAVKTTHEDLAGTCWINQGEIPANGIDDDQNGYIDDVRGYDVSDNDDDVNPPSWATNSFFTHGTHVAGIACAHTNNGVGISGMSYNCRYIPVKTKPDNFNGPGLPYAYLGLEYAIVAGADIINMSWGGFAFSNTYQLLCDVAYDAGIVLVAAAGNTGTNVNVYPSCYDHVISVGSVNYNDVISVFSAYGPCIDVVAPGVNIYSCLAGSNNAYGSLSGTSMAAPLVSGICGLMLSSNPAMTVDEVEQCLKSGSTNINAQNPMKIGQFGSGRADALGAVTCSEAPPYPFIYGCENVIYVCPGNTVTFHPTSLGLSATSWYWLFPGGTPSTSTEENPTVTYNYPGFYDVIVIGCNAFGCDTTVFHNLVMVTYPHAELSSVYTGTVCRGSAAYLKISFFGNPPFSFSYTDGIIHDTITNIMSFEYYVPVVPQTNTTYMITWMKDASCVGTVQGTVTMNPVDCTPCSNTDFEFGNFSTWLGQLGHCCGMGNFVPGMSPDRHVITSGTGTDPYSNGMIPVVSPYGGQRSARLGNYYVMGEAEILEKMFLVTPDNASFTYQFALVLEDPVGHPPKDKPKFEVRIFDQYNQLLPDSCSYYQVTAGPETDNWFHNNTVRYHPWTAVTIDLTAYIGQILKIQFKTEDCGWMGHFGYAYVDASCGPNQIEVLNFCSSDDTITLSAPIGYIKYFWMPYGDTTQTIHIPAPDEGDTITVTMLNAAGCYNTITKIIHMLPYPQPVISSDVHICAQDTAKLWVSGAGEGGSYLWYSSLPGFSSQSDTIYVSPMQTTTYYAKVTNANGCTSDSVVQTTVFVDNSLAFDLGPNVELCIEDSVTIYSTAIAADSIHWYSWPPFFSSEEDSIRVPAYPSATYILVAYNGLCDYRDSIKVSVYNYYYDDPITQVEFCTGNNFVVLSAPDGYSKFYWLETADTTQQIYIYNPVAYSIFSVAMISPLGCSDTQRFMLKLIPDPHADAGNDTSVCKGFSIQLSGSGSESPDATYHWESIPAGFTADTKNIIVAPEVTTAYILTVTNGPSCPSPPSVDTVIVSIVPSPIFEAGPDRKLCKGDSLIVTINIPGAFPYWESDPPGFLSTDTTVVLKPLETTTYFVTFNTHMCTYSDYFKVIVMDNPGTKDIFEVNFCSGDTVVTLSAPESYTTYYWANSSDTSRVINIHQPVNDSVVLLLAHDTINPCNDSLFFVLKEIIANYKPQIIASDTAICQGEKVLLSVIYDTTVHYLWYSNPPGLMISDSVQITVGPLDTTKYFCETNQYGCIKVDSVVIYASPSPFFNLGNDIFVCEGDSIFFRPEVYAESFLWSDGDTSKNRYLSKEGKYILKAAIGGCYWMDSLFVTFVDNEEVRVPNVFTPNGDSYNDFFEVLIVNPILYELKIYDRWGVVMFETNNPQDKWNGEYKGNKCSEGVYFYTLRYNTTCNRKITERNGFIHLLR